jgi:diguanylate cyclase (GGDEF)-like protein
MDPAPSSAPAPDPPTESGSSAGSDAENRLVTQAATRAIMRSLTLPAAATFPLVISFAVLFADLTERSRLVPWVVSGAVASAISLLALAFANEMGNAGRIERAQPALVLAGFVIGATWGGAAFLIDAEMMATAGLFLLFPLGASMLSIIVCAPATSVFVSFQTALAGAVSVALLLDPTPESVAVLGAGLSWMMTSLVLYRMVHRDARDTILLRLRTDHLVARLSEERQQLEQLNLLLQHQATHDQLTELANRWGTLEFLQQMLTARADDELVGLIYLDLDHFKHVNDSYGHQAGDALLHHTAQRIRQALPPNAVAGRIGGDEMVVILPGLHDASQAMEVAARLTTTVRQPVHAHGREFMTTVSIGLAIAPLHASTPDALMRFANAALHRAKANGRSRVEQFDARLRSEIDERHGAEFELRRALDQGEIVPFLQPEIDATTGRVVGAEVLARWLRRDGTVLNAVAFVPTARDLGLLDRLQTSVLNQASPVIRRLHMLGLPQDFRFRINLTSSIRERLWTPDLTDRLLHSLPPELITVDITEHLVADDLTEAASVLASMRAIGVRVGLDDFGRGGSSIMLLRRLPLDEIRLDRGVLDGVSAHASDRAIIRAIVTLAHDLGLAITADGVETPTQADTLLALGCSRQQGHLYSPALPPGAFERFLVDRELTFSRPQHSQETWSTDELI